MQGRERRAWLGALLTQQGQGAALGGCGSRQCSGASLRPAKHWSRAAIVNDRAQVAACIVRGIERGRYHLLTPDLGSNLLISLTSGLAPRAWPLLVSMLIGWVAPLVQCLFSWRMDAAARRYNAAHAQWAA